jgi:hypothetical protein
VKLALSQPVKGLQGFLGQLFVNPVLRGEDIQAYDVKENDGDTRSVGEPVDKVKNIHGTSGDIDWQKDPLRFHKPESVHARFRI